jgi:O-antigen ligase
MRFENGQNIISSLIIVSSTASYLAIPGFIRAFFLVSNILLLLLGVVFVSRKVSLKTIVPAIYLMFIVILSLSVNLAQVGVQALQSLMYPIVFFLQLAYGRELMESLRRSRLVLITFVCILAFMWLGVVASAGSEVGRNSFIPTLMASQSFALNENYYSSIMAVLTIFFAFRASEAENARSVLIILALISTVGVLIGASRGVLFSGLAALGLVVFLRDRLYGGVLLLISFLAGYGIWVSYEDVLSDLLRVYKGFNGRDLIWFAVLQGIADNWAFGIGADTSSALETIGAGEFGGRSTHSGFLEVVFKFGVIQGSILWALILLYLTQMKRRTKLGWLAFYLTSFFILMACFRTYHPGGVGLIPLLGAIGLAVGRRE